MMRGLDGEMVMGPQGSGQNNDRPFLSRA
jgi:hypothetical protein